MLPPEGITERFGPLVANDATGLDLASGEAPALLGGNGTGRTTLRSGPTFARH